MQQASPPAIIADGDLVDNLRSFARHLRARNVSGRTVQTYTEAGEQFAAFLASAGMPTDVAKIKREHVESFIEDLLNRRHANGRQFKATTAHNRFRGLKAFFGWLVDEGEIKSSPMERMKPPKLPEEPVPVLSDADLKALLGTVSTGRGFDERRDHALLRLFLSTGARLAEVANLRYDRHDPEASDVDLDAGIVRIRHGKGNRTRFVNLNPKAVQALDRYVRARVAHAHAESPWLWLGRKGRFGESGIGQMVADRGRQAGLPGRVHPHQLRHTAVDRNLRAGLQETSAMKLFGWKSREMLSRYAAATATQRSLEEQRRVMAQDDL